MARGRSHLSEKESGEISIVVERQNLSSPRQTTKASPKKTKQKERAQSWLTACWPASRVPGNLTLLVAAPAEIIGAGMHDDHALHVNMSALTSWFNTNEDDMPWAKKKTPEEHREGMTYPQHTLRPNQFDQMVSDGGFGIALCISRKIS